ncbi:MAG: hypothetical protein U9P00_01345 [Pseudomonadota bacterium]|nr:hypothetical protein [Pseudomonadota bacterium]
MTTTSNTPSLDYESFIDPSLQDAADEAAEQRQNDDTLVEVRKPKKNTEFFRSLPAGKIGPLPIIEYEGEDFLVHPSYSGFARTEDTGAIKGVYYTPCVNRKGNLFAWKVGVGRNSWNESAAKVLESAREQWVSSHTVRGTDQGEYRCKVGVAEGQTLEPDFPDYETGEWLEQIFGASNIITDDNHPVMKALQGL